MAKNRKHPDFLSKSLTRLVKKKSVLYDVMLGIQSNSSNHNAVRRRAFKGRSDIGLLFCTGCRKVWEYKKTFYRQKRYADFLLYDDMPSYGKKRKKCPHCQKQ